MGVLDAPSISRVEANLSYAVKATEAMALKGFSPKTAPVKKIWVNPGIVGHGMTSGGSAGTTFNLNDTSDYCLGSQSVAITTNGAGTGAFAQVQKTGLTIDATGQSVRLWVKIDDLTKTRQMTIMLGDDTFTNYYQGQFFSTVGLSPAEAKSNIKSGEWTYIDVPFSDLVTVVGTPSRAAITAVRIQVQDLGVVCTVRFNGIAGVTANDKYPNGVISLTFDDSYDGAYTIARPYMDKYGYGGTLYPIVEAIGQAGRLTLAQMKVLQSANGWEIGHHAMTYTSHAVGAQNMSAATLTAECEALRSWGATNGVSGDSFAWPQTTSSLAAEQIVARYFRTARGGINRTHESLPPSRPFRIRAEGAAAGVTLGTLTAAVDVAKNSPGWTIFTFHNIVASGNTGNDTTTAIFQGLMDYINTAGVPVATVTQVMDRI